MLLATSIPPTPTLVFLATPVITVMYPKRSLCSAGGGVVSCGLLLFGLTGTKGRVEEHVQIAKRPATFGVLIKM